MQKWKKAALVLVLAASLLPAARVAWTSRDLPGLGNVHDDAIYWVAAKALAEGRGYRIASLPGEPWETKYPPLYPLWLSLAWRTGPAFPANLPVAVLLNWWMLPVLAWLCWRFYLTTGLSPPAAVLLTGALAINPYVVLSSASLLSELMFTCWLLAAVIAAERAMREEASLGAAAMAALLAGGACLTRSAGMPLVLTGPLGFLMRRQYRKAALFGAVLLPFVAGWNCWAGAHFRPTKDALLLYYTNYFRYHAHCFPSRDVAPVVLQNLRTLWNSFGNLLMLSAPGIQPVAWLVTAVALAGVVRLGVRGKASSYALFAGAYLLLLLFWDFPRGERFTVILLPLVLAGFYTGAVEIHGRLRGPAARMAWCAVIGGLALAAAIGTAGGLNALETAAAGDRAAIRGLPEVYRWISSHTPGDAVILARRDPVLYLYTQRKAMFPVPSLRRFYWADEQLFVDHSSLDELARAHGADYLLVTPRELNADRLERFVDAESLRRSDFRLVYESAAASVYRKSSGANSFR